MVIKRLPNSPLVLVRCGKQAPKTWLCCDLLGVLNRRDFMCNNLNGSIPNGR
ncbi:hypothetical protein HanXRQr2_Chr07g0287521 [Helianthus annuus]|uniref:Uncharacterized protein n=1 Tax=Helianthus annuus TaxID=4232 RepID=A0A251UKW9_HELAN|nr:hypothetical protein HanXRQr2_Chr07g0287521 [Helianthus annuus]KAJ0904129.1 hypothetical protein HanPSC8_Chr07g0278361 [Helianthus annuus]